MMNSRPIRVALLVDSGLLDEHTVLESVLKSLERFTKSVSTTLEPLYILTHQEFTEKTRPVILPDPPTEITLVIPGRRWEVRAIDSRTKAFLDALKYFSQLEHNKLFVYLDERSTQQSTEKAVTPITRFKHHLSTGTPIRVYSSTNQLQEYLTEDMRGAILSIHNRRLEFRFELMKQFWHRVCARNDIRSIARDLFLSLARNTHYQFFLLSYRPGISTIQPAKEILYSDLPLVASDELAATVRAHEFDEIAINRRTTLTHRFLKPSEKMTSSSITLIPMESALGKPIGYLATAKCTLGPSEYLQLDPVIEEAASNFGAYFGMKEADHNLRLIAARISHDMVAPIVSIRNRVRFVTNQFMEMPHEETLRRLQDIALDAQTLLRLTQSISEFEGTPQPETPQPTDIYTDIVLKSVHDLRRAFNQSGTRQPVLDARNLESLPKLRLPQRALWQIVYNLLVNMAKYGEKGANARHPRIQVEATEDTYDLIFENWGEGIATDERDKIFEEGYRGRSGATRTVGTGLGLSVARHLARSQLNGDVVLASEKNPTQFRLRIPKKWDKQTGAQE